MIYIDFDGVILDTEELLFEEWRKNEQRHLLTDKDKVKYIQDMDWEYILNNSMIINDADYYLKEMDIKNSFILTKIHSLENEGVNKIKWIRSKGIKQNVILVPYEVRKTDIVDAKNNILVDDCLKNLDDWVNDGGYPILFDINNDNYDSWNKFNEKGYKKVLSLKKIKDMK